MHKSFPFVFKYLVVALMVMSLSGCTVIFKKGKRKDVQQIAQLASDYQRLQDEVSDLERAKQELESRLRNEIDDKEVKVEMLERGLVITF